MDWKYYQPKFEYEEIFQDIEWPWAGHKNFAYDLVRNIKPKVIVELGTHKGTSFFSMCQAVKDGKQNTKLHAIDTWKGDEEAGLYDEDVFKEVKKIKEKYYSKLDVFLLRMTFDEAVSNFKDESIDILHIDGLHTYETVKHDFENWLKKVRKDGIILFHDTHEKTRGFGVYKLWNELQGKYNNIDFYHSHGLGVLIKKSGGLKELGDFREIWKLYYSVLFENKVLENKTETAIKENNMLTNDLETALSKVKTVTKENSMLKEGNSRLTEHDKNLDIILNQIKSAKFFKLWQGYNLVKKITKQGIKNPRKVLKGGKILLTKGPRGVFEKISSQNEVSKNFANINDQYQVWLKKNYPKSEDLDKQRRESKDFKVRPKISILTPTYNTPEKFLRECIESVINQTYDNWELCIADDASANEKVRNIIKEYAKKDKRIKYLFRKENGHISRASNDALKLASGEFVGLLDHDDILWPNALYEVAKVINENPDTQFVYSDEDKLEEDGITHADPFFKPDWSPDYLRSINYITHFAVLKKLLIKKVEGFRVGFEGAQDWDLFFRATRELTRNNKDTQILHIPTILYSWRKSSSSTSSHCYVEYVKGYAYLNQQKALEDNLKQSNHEGLVESSSYMGVWKTEYKVKGRPLVSIIIPTKDKYEYISRCLKSVLNKTSYRNYELVIVDTGSKEKRVWDLYEETKKKHPQTSVLKWEEGFNFASVCNFGVKKSKGEYIVLLNNDTKLITYDWIQLMLGYAQHKEAGAVGCKLLYPDNRIQHAGVVLGIRGGPIEKGVAGHAFKYFTNSDHGEHLQMMHSVKDYSAVTAACLMISKEKYLSVGGIDPIFRVAFNDVDFCLKLREKKLYNVYLPFVVLYHYESVSVGSPEAGNRDLVEFAKEINLMHSKWGNILQHDPFYNPNFSLDREDYSINIR